MLQLKDGVTYNFKVIETNGQIHYVKMDKKQYEALFDSNMWASFSDGSSIKKTNIGSVSRNFEADADDAKRSNPNYLKLQEGEDKPYKGYKNKRVYSGMVLLKDILVKNEIMDKNHAQHIDLA